jgi:hypothetical protein
MSDTAIQLQVFANFFYERLFQLTLNTLMSVHTLSVVHPIILVYRAIVGLVTVNLSVMNHQ